MWLLQQGVRTYFHAILCNKRLHFVIDLDNFDMLAFKLLKTMHILVCIVSIDTAI